MTWTQPYRRKREGRTDYRKRLKLLVSRSIRLVVRLSERHVVAQLVEYSVTGDKVLVTASSKELEKLGWKAGGGSLPAAYLVGALLARKAAKLKLEKAILDTGKRTPLARSRVYAVLRGSVEQGLKVPHGEEILPEESRVQGKHIEEYAKFLKGADAERYRKQFSAYLKREVDPTAFTKYVNSFKEKVLQ